MAENTLDTQSLSFQDLRKELNKPAPVQDEPETPVKTETLTPEPEPVKAEETPVETLETEKPAEPQPKKAEKRFSKLTQRAQEAEARAEALAAELAALRNAPVKAEPVKAEPTEAKPTPPDANSWTGTWAELETARLDYAEKLAEWKVTETLRKRDAEAAAKVAKETAEKVHESWTQQVDRVADSYDDMEAAIKEVGSVVSKLSITEVIKESEVGAEIVVHLHKDKELLAKLSKMSPYSAAREIGRIEDRILAKAEPVKATPAKALPKPPAVVGGAPSGDSSTVDLGKLDFRSFKSQFKKLR